MQHGLQYAAKDIGFCGDLNQLPQDVAVLGALSPNVSIPARRSSFESPKMPPRNPTSEGRGS